MLITKREFFKRKNRKILYNIYADIVDRAYDVSESYRIKLDLLKARKEQYRMDHYLWEILDKVEKDNSSNFEYLAFVKCAGIKQSAFIVNTYEYGQLIFNIRKLQKAIGNIEAAINFVDYFERNKLELRSAE